MPYNSYWRKKSDKCPMLKVNGYDMEKLESDTYLGDIIASNGKNTLNIEWPKAWALSAR